MTSVYLWKRIKLEHNTRFILSDRDLKFLSTVKELKVTVTLKSIQLSICEHQFDVNTSQTCC